MKRISLIILVAVIIGILVGVYWWSSRSGTQASEENNANPTKETDGPVARVKTVPIRKGTITEDIAVNGTVIPAPDAVQVVSVPFECQVRHVMVSEGQEVSAGDVLLEIEPSPDTYLQLEKARSAYESTKESLRQMQQRLDLKLVTNDQLLQAKQAFREAELAFESMKQRGIDGQRKILADVAGLSNKVHVQEGAIVPAGNPLVEIVAQNRLEIRLGVEPEDIGHVQSDQPVLLNHANEPAQAAITGRIRKISRSVNSTTRLVDVFVTIPTSAKFLLGESMFGSIPIASAQGLIVPRSAVLPEEGQNVFFIVQNGHAVKHSVPVGLENEKEIEVMGSDLREGDPVVVLGNYELEDGMAVKTENIQ